MSKRRLHAVPNPPAPQPVPAPEPPAPVQGLLFVLTREQATELFNATYAAQSVLLSSGDFAQLAGYDMLRGLLQHQSQNQVALLKDVASQYALQQQLLSQQATPPPTEEIVSA